MSLSSLSTGPHPRLSATGQRSKLHKTGAFYDADEEYLHATGSVVNSEGTIINGVYSTMAIGHSWRRIVSA